MASENDKIAETVGNDRPQKSAADAYDSKHGQYNWQPKPDALEVTRPVPTPAHTPPKRY